MTIDDAIKKLTAKSECMRRDVIEANIDCKFRDCDECSLCYEQGTTGEQREALQMAIEALKAHTGEMATDRTCKNCKYAPPGHKWPCVDCDIGLA